MDHAVEVRNLVKEYGSRRAVDGLSFHVEAGEIYALLGPNGAGKSTTLTILTGLMAPTSGRVAVAGFDPLTDPIAARSRLGWAGQETSVYPDLTAAENLRLACVLARVPRAETRGRVGELLEAVGLSDRARNRVGTFSGGMKRRLHLAVALVHRPRVLLLDEPLVGIDPQTRAYLLGMIRSLAEQGAAVLLTTHDLADAEQLAHRIGIMDRGRMLAEGTLEELRARAGRHDVIRLSGSFGTEVEEALRAVPARLLAAGEDRIVLEAEDGAAALPAVLERLTARGGEVRRATIERPTLETLFLELTGRELRD